MTSKDVTDKDQLAQIPLGKTTEYHSQYDPTLLYPVKRSLGRQQLGLDCNQPMPFFGDDVWHGYELSWLNRKGKPQVALARFVFSFDSENIVESKSFKLYLGSFNQSAFDSSEQVKSILEKDLSACANGRVNVQLFSPDMLEYFTPTNLPGECIDELDITVEHYDLNPAYLENAFDGNARVCETLHSHLLKSNCLITNQPDWASVMIRYCGRKIEREALLQYLISFRQHNEFHEQCVERIYTDIQRYLKPEELTVAAYYTRRGGLDINPCRSSKVCGFPMARINRQ